MKYDKTIFAFVLSVAIFTTAFSPLQVRAFSFKDNAVTSFLAAVSSVVDSLFSPHTTPDVPDTAAPIIVNRTFAVLSPQSTPPLPETATTLNTVAVTNFDPRYSQLSDRLDVLESVFTTPRVSDISRAEVMDLISGSLSQTSRSMGNAITDTVNNAVSTINTTIASNSSWITSGSDIYFTTGKVGIGTNSPYTSLTNYNSNVFDAAGFGLLTSQASFSWSASGSGYVAAIENQDSNNTQRNGLLVKTAATDNNSYIAKFESGGVNSLSVRADGSTSMGTTSINYSARLTVSGYTNLRVAANQNIYINSPGGRAGILAWDNNFTYIPFGIDASSIVLQGSNQGNVGIGTTSPGSRLAVLQSTNDNTGGIQLAASDGDTRAIYMDTSGVLHFLGAGSASTDATLTAGGTWTNGSDRAFKQNIQDLRYGLNDLMRLQPRSYSVISNGEQQIGFVAQELESVIPEVVSGEEGRKGVAYGNLVALTVSSIQDMASVLGIQAGTTTPVVSVRLDAIESRLSKLEGQQGSLVGNVMDVISNSITATVGIFDTVRVKKGIEIESQNGQVYCVQIDNAGNWIKNAGSCSSQSQQTQPPSGGEPPVIIEPVPVVEIIDTIKENTITDTLPTEIQPEQKLEPTLE